jgi:hypothetical protein
MTRVAQPPLLRSAGFKERLKQTTDGNAGEYLPDWIEPSGTSLAKFPARSKTVWLMAARADQSLSWTSIRRCEPFAAGDTRIVNRRSSMSRLPRAWES